MLTPDAPEFRFANHDPLASLFAYFELGISHILTGPDHLLFVLALLLLLRSFPTLLKTVTAFTLAHSITLALITLKIISPQIALIEALVALSIVFTAVEVTRFHRAQSGMMQRHPWLIALVFGLLHGSAFGGELVQIGLPPETIVSALLLFNLGIEIGQLLFIAVVLLVRHLIWLRKPIIPSTELATAYAIGSLGALWFFQRMGDIFPRITTTEGIL